MTALAGFTKDVAAHWTSALAQDLPSWVVAQRWFVGQAKPQDIHPVGYQAWPCPDRGVQLQIWILQDDTSKHPTLYQVPLSIRSTRLADESIQPISEFVGDDLGTRFIYDAAHDPSYSLELLRHSLRTEKISADLALTSHRVLGGEQSNTSVVAAINSPAIKHELIIKIFRVVQAGSNPEVTLPSALYTEGSTLIPRPMGELTSRWPDSRAESGWALGQLVFVQEFLANSPDAWQVALAAVAQNANFSDEATALGRAIAQLHAQLRSTHTVVRVAESAEKLAESFISRLADTAEQVPEIARLATQITEYFARIRQIELPPLQRIHGDLHLGQILRNDRRGWQIIDFEGEPLRPLAQRNAPDFALRDIAGLLRSFEYAVGLEQTPAGMIWSDQARTAFCLGYGEVSGQDPRSTHELLTAFELDKAIYEARYEAAHRPQWLPIPLAGIQRILSNGPGNHSDSV